MRSGPLRGLIAGAIVLGLSGVPARAQAPAEIAVTLEIPDALTVGDRAEVIATVRVEPPNDLPLLVTPWGEGPAVDVVRGRLLRADADAPEASPLRFRIPIVARRSGTAVVRVRVTGWVCVERCRQGVAEASAVLRVSPGGS